jgi:hypothetical protein
MADGLHALVFVDNHDNQRGHGGGGGVLTACSKISFSHFTYSYILIAESNLQYNYRNKAKKVKICNHLVYVVHHWLQCKHMGLQTGF